nr:MAG TPA: hypothetical protein [Caudoviricetes sp.]
MLSSLIKNIIFVIVFCKILCYFILNTSKLYENIDFL